MCKVYLVLVGFILFFVFKQKTAYDMRISDWSSDVCSSDLHGGIDPAIESIREIIGLNPVGHLDNLLVGEHQPAEQRRLGRCVDKAITPRHGSPRHRRVGALAFAVRPSRSEEHTYELQSLMRNSYAVFCLKKYNKYILTSI